VRKAYHAATNVRVRNGLRGITVAVQEIDRLLRGHAVVHAVENLQLFECRAQKRHAVEGDELPDPPSIAHRRLAWRARRCRAGPERDALLRGDLRRLARIGLLERLRRARGTLDRVLRIDRDRTRYEMLAGLVVDGSDDLAQVADRWLPTLQAIVKRR